MNLTNFLKQTDALTAGYETEQLAAFIHDIGRTLPEHQREDFLKRLKSAGETAENDSAKNATEDAEFTKLCSHIKDNLKRIASHEIMLTAILNEEYDDWYDDGEDEFYYRDNSGISEMLEEACDFVHTCMDSEKYKEGFEVGKLMLSTEIFCDNEYGDGIFSLGDMVYHGLLDCDLRQVLLDTAYCIYCAVPPSKRPEALYGILEGVEDGEITIEAVMQHGDEELPDFEDFLPCWIAYLSRQSGHNADRLILEAVGLLNDVSLAVRYAEEYADIHPGLYLNILENRSYAAANDMVSIGLKAISTIPKKYVIRSKAALKTAEYIIETDGDGALLEQCYFAAFESDTCARNYLRALSNGYEEKREEFWKVFMKSTLHIRDTSFGVYGGGSLFCERDENRPDGNMILLLRFLDGQFADVLEKGLNKSEALGWTGTFMKQGIALYLLYLYEGKWIGKGIAAMADMAKSAMKFSAKEYREGVCGIDEIEEDELFCRLFLKWKSIVQMEPDVRERAVKRIGELLEKRTKGIMEANRRNYYGECAAYIAALGEVRESMGEAGAKQTLMTAYKDKYVRRNAFRAEMRNYGWIG